MLWKKTFIVVHVESSRDINMVWLSVNCYETRPVGYVDGKTNVGHDGELLDRVLEPDEK